MCWRWWSRCVGTVSAVSLGTAVVRGGTQRVEVVERAEERVDIAVVGDVVAGIFLRRAVERAQPDGIDSERDEVIEAARDAGEVPDAVAGCIRERARIDLVDDGRAPPLGAGAALADRGERARGKLFGLTHANSVAQALAHPKMREPTTLDR